MRVTYVERNRMTKQLQGFAAGFNATEAILEINEVCTTYLQKIVVGLGKTCLMDRRDERLVVRLEHSQTIGEEYRLINEALCRLHVPSERRDFKPHISLAHIPSIGLETKLRIANEVAGILPKEVALSGIQTFPRNPSQRNR